MVIFTHSFISTLFIGLLGNKVLLWLVIIVAFDLLILFIYLLRKRKLNSVVAVEPTPAPTAGAILSLVDDERAINNRNAIFLFGNFKIHTTNQYDISGKFSPLLKELFLLIFLNSLNHNRGISSSYIVEKLWPDMADKNARNNLAVNIGKLRGVLGSDFHEQLVNQSGVWRFETHNNDANLYCDYIRCLHILKSKQEHSLAEIKSLMHIVQKGGLLVDLNYEWLDSFKANISNEIVDTLLAFMAGNSANVSPNLIIQMADAITLLDMANENAMEMKCKALVSLGKHSLANEIYLKFVKEYKILYNIDYKHDFKSIIS